MITPEKTFEAGDVEPFKTAPPPDEVYTSPKDILKVSIDKTE